MVGVLTASIVDARVERGGRRRRRRRRLLLLLRSRRGQRRRRYGLMRPGKLGQVLVVVMVVVVLVLVLVLVVLMLMLVMVVLLLLLLVTQAEGTFQSWRDDVDRGCRALLVQLQPLLLPPVGDASTTRRGVHRSAVSCPAFPLAVSKQLRGRRPRFPL